MPELPIKSPARLTFFSRKLPRPYVRPVLFDIVQALAAGRFAIDHPPAGWNIGKGRPQAVLLLVVDQDEECAILVIEWVGAQRFSWPSATGVAWTLTVVHASSYQTNPVHSPAHSDRSRKAFARSIRPITRNAGIWAKSPATKIASATKAGVAACITRCHR